MPTGTVKIKCGRHEYELKNGDYILDNEYCYQFIPKDNSLLPFDRYDKKTSVIVSRGEFKRLIKFTKWEVKITGNKEDRTLLTYYIWRE
jgi:hypothetical protein